MSEILIAQRPEGWNLYRLGQVFEERKQKASDKDFEALSVTMQGIVPQLDTAAKTDDGDNRKLVRKGDYVINSRSDRKGSGGISPLDGTVSLISIVLQPRNDIESAFAHHLLRSVAFQEEFYRMGHGIVADLWTTRFAEMKNIRFHLPDLATQKRIAAFLDRETARIDELIAKKERLVEVLNATHAATPLRVMAGGMGVIQYDPTNNRVDFSSLADGWKRVRVKQVAKHMTSGSRGWSDFIQDDGELFLQSGSIDRKMGISFEDSHRVAPRSGAEADRTTVHNGDTLVCITGGRTGAVGFVSGLNERAYINQHVCLIRPSKAIAERLLAQILFSEIGQLHFQMAQYGLKQGMGFEQVANVAIPLPPREQQEAITAAIDAQASKNTEAASQIMTSVDRLREYRAALITSAVTGQIDVGTYGKTGTPSATLDRIEEEMQA